MSKHRIVKSDFWIDDYIEGLSIRERYYFLYLLTCPETNILGIYRNTIRRMAFETGLAEDNIKMFLDKFAADDKVHYIDGHIIMVNFQRHNIPNGTMRTGIQKILNQLPESVINFILSKKSRVFDRLSIPYHIAYTYPNKDKDINKNINKNTGNKRPIPAPNPEKYQLKKTTIKWANKKGISESDLNKIKESCFIWHSSKGNHYTDWDKVLQTWIVKEEKREKDKPITHNMSV